jgi:hypothetical protein
MNVAMNNHSNTPFTWLVLVVFNITLVALVCAQDEQPAAGQGDSVVTLW